MSTDFKCRLLAVLNSQDGITNTEIIVSAPL